MEVGKTKQISDMFLMPHVSSVQNTANEQLPIKSTKQNSFQDELDLKTDMNKTSEKETYRNESDDGRKIKEYDKKLNEQPNDENNRLNDKNEKNDKKDKTNHEEGQKNTLNKDKEHSDNKLKNKNAGDKEGRNSSTDQKIPIRNKIEEIKEGIRKNEIITKQIKEKVNTKFTEQKTGTEKSAEKLLFQQNDEKKDILKKPVINKTEEFDKVIENRFKNIKNAENDIKKEPDQISKTEKDVSAKENPAILKNESIKENPITSNFNLNLEKEIASSEVKLDKAANIRQLYDQYQEISDKILNKVSNVINHLATKGGETITIRLQPPELGKIQIELVMKDNTINAKINTENIAVKEVIMTNLDQIKASIENSGFNINKLDVEIGGFKNFLSNESQNFTNDKNGKKGSKSGGSGFNNSADVINKPLNPYTFFVGRSINMLV